MSSPVREASGPTQDPAGELLRGGAWPGLAALLLSAAVMLLIRGWDAAGAAALGGLLAVAGLAVGPLVMGAAARMNPVGVMAAALSAYGAVVFVLAVVYAVLEPQEWLDGDAVAVGMLAAAVSSLAGQFHRTRRLRTLVYQDTDLPD